VQSHLNSNSILIYNKRNCKRSSNAKYLLRPYDTYLIFDLLAWFILKSLSRKINHLQFNKLLCIYMLKYVKFPMMFLNKLG